MKHDRLSPLILLICLWAAGGCSTPPLRERWSDLTSEERKSFLAHYPEFSPGERDRIESGGLIPELREIDIWSEVISRVEITATPSEHVPREYTLESTLHYKDGRKKEATRDTVFQVQPALARIEGGRILRHGCAHSEVSIGADFFGEAGGNLKLQLKDSLKELAIKRDPSYEGRNEPGMYRVQAIVTCEDGATSDVSCLATWTTTSKAIELTGCGKVRVLDAKTADTSPGSRIEARYGGKSSSAAFRFAPPLQSDTSKR